jgi:hypothetical protein
MPVGDAYDVWLHLKPGSNENHEREALRMLGIYPLRTGYYRILVERVSKGKYEQEMEEPTPTSKANRRLLPGEEPKPVCTCSPELRKAAPGYHSSACPVIGGDGT